MLYPPRSLYTAVLPPLRLSPVTYIPRARNSVGRLVRHFSFRRAYHTNVPARLLCSLFTACRKYGLGVVGLIISNTHEGRSPKEGIPLVSQAEIKVYPRNQVNQPRMPRSGRISSPPHLLLVTISDLTAAQLDESLSFGQFARSLHPDRHARSTVGNGTTHTHTHTNTRPNTKHTATTHGRTYFSDPFQTGTHHRTFLSLSPTRKQTHPKARHERRRRTTFSAAVSVMCLFGLVRTCMPLCLLVERLCITVHHTAAAAVVKRVICDESAVARYCILGVNSSPPKK